ncbi:SWI/SNF-related matrix-associated actin-dependent regulator of chromatin subfamily A-like protein 1 [Galendromus occidentalis]|uniref:SWI/SNF-related matrix-associated actin-dependent regulator of chromatin subfamily A-like protein 1 n=1 Tax=Galendromus occidentalis TaxID=34638 RepID=A0AAJ6VX01_9ACAR|nr:SWI/SNF-related matrix-associated actin-dependent regulator of chromatin subfamily A-like protein 1 [Galendromus occidentalis]
MENLSEELRQRIEFNKAQALARRKQKEAERIAQSREPQLNPVPAPDPSAAPRGVSTHHGNASNFFGKKTFENTSRAVSTFHKAQVGPTKDTKAPKKEAAKTTGMCFLLSGEEFRLQCGFNQALIDLFKSHPKGRLDPTTRNYVFKLECHESLLNAAKKVAPEVTITGLPLFISKMLRSNIKQPDSQVDLRSIDPKLRKALMPFQTEGVVRGISQNGKILIADDMGLGKTVQSLAIASYYREEWPLLIVCPSSMRFNWRQAIVQWLPSLTEDDIQVIVKTNEPLGANQVVITSYEMMGRRSEDLLGGNFKVLIFDESHFLKNYKSQRTKVAQELSAESRRIILLSGTPALSRPVELYPQIRCLALKHLPSIYDFAARYCNARETRFGLDMSGSSNLEELHILLKAIIMIRRLKSEVLDQLPAKQRNVLILDPTLVDAKDAQADNYSLLLQKESLTDSEKRSALMSYFRLTSEMKRKAVCKYIEELLESDCKFLVFAHHQYLLNALAEVLTKKKVKYIRIDGKVSSEARQTLCEEFQTSDACRVALLSITAANAGITLHAASLVVFAELFWNPGILTQAEDRVHRIGQTQTCLVTYLIARGTADDFIWPIIEGKLSVLNRAGLSKDSFTGAMHEKKEHKARTSDDSDDGMDYESRPATTKRQKTMLDFVSLSEDSFWADLSQDTTLPDI